MFLGQKRVDSFQMAKIAKKVFRVKTANKVLEEVAEQILEEVAAGNTGDEEWSKGADIGRECRMMDEKNPGTFGAPAKVKGHKGSQLKLEIEGVFHSVVCDESLV